jgi:hypothetical protein
MEAGEAPHGPPGQEPQPNSACGATDEGQDQVSGYQAGLVAGQAEGNEEGRAGDPEYGRSAALWALSNWPAFNR